MILRLKRRAFVDKLDFVTSPGHQPDHAGAIPGGGPARVITDKALFDFGGPQRSMRLVELYPGVGLDNVRAEVGWSLAVADEVAETPAPTLEELHLMRERLDPQGIYRS
jgi:glutaconate CoA-transferase subunit B